MKKDFTNLLIARISKKDLKEKHPDWFETFGIVDFIKNEYKEILKDLLIERIVEQAKKQDYYLYDEIIVREMENSFVAFAIAYPKFVSGKPKKLRPPKITPEEFTKIVQKKIEEFGIIGVSPEGIYNLYNQNEQQRI